MWVFKVILFFMLHFLSFDGALKMNIFTGMAGINCAFAEEAVAINTIKKQCCSPREVNKRAIVTPES
jgi:hypothetical protein